MSENNQMMSVEGQIVGMPLAGPESFSQQQLDYLKRALGVDETVLWSNNSGTEVNTSLSISLSEAYSNFDRIRFVTSRVTLGHNDEYTTIGGNATDVFLESCQVASDVYLIDCATLHLDGTAVTCTGACRKTFSSTSFTTGTTSPMKIYKIIGIHRIAGGNQ